MGKGMATPKRGSVAANGPITTRSRKLQDEDESDDSSDDFQSPKKMKK
jgi:hypothetical protein